MTKEQILAMSERLVELCRHWPVDHDTATVLDAVTMLRALARAPAEPVGEVRHAPNGDIYSALFVQFAPPHGTKLYAAPPDLAAERANTSRVILERENLLTALMKAEAERDAARVKALEEAARVCDSRSSRYSMSGRVAQACADDIRALKEKP